MKITAMYSLNKGEELIFEKHPDIYKQAVVTIHSIDAEKAIIQGILHTPPAFSIYVKQSFKHLEWKPYHETFMTPNQYYTKVYDLEEDKTDKNIHLDMDFIINGLGIEIAFGKHPKMLYSTTTKMSIFKGLNLIEMGLVILPIKQLSQEMQTDISSFEQVTWDLEHLGGSLGDVPVMVLGVGV